MNPGLEHEPRLLILVWMEEYDTVFEMMKFRHEKSHDFSALHMKSYEIEEKL